MRKLSKKPTVNKFITTDLLNKDFIIYTSKKLIVSLNLFKKGLIAHILPCKFLAYKKRFKYTYLNFQDFSLKSFYLIYIYKGFVFRNNVKILRFLRKHIKFLPRVNKIKILLIYFLTLLILR